jgi:predicted lipid-binding transport protein (Tim44 family)
MQGGIPYIDILIFAIIAIFLGLRLRSVLGKRTGFEQEYTRDPEALNAIKGQAEAEQPSSEINGDDVAALVAADPSFDEKAFTKGARSAYEIVLKAFADGDIETLKPLLGYEMNASFSDAIRERSRVGEVLSIDLISLDQAIVTAAKLRDGLASVIVEFTSQQKRLLKDENGKLLDGADDETETFIDLWTFERDISSQDPTWLLVETESVQ